MNFLKNWENIDRATIRAMPSFKSVEIIYISFYPIYNLYELFYSSFGFDLNINFVWHVLKKLNSDNHLYICISFQKFVLQSIAVCFGTQTKCCYWYIALTVLLLLLLSLSFSFCAVCCMKNIVYKLWVSSEFTYLCVIGPV